MAIFNSYVTNYQRVPEATGPMAFRRFGVNGTCADFASFASAPGLAGHQAMAWVKDGPPVERAFSCLRKVAKKSMVYGGICLVFIGVLMVYKPTNITGHHPVEPDFKPHKLGYEPPMI